MDKSILNKLEAIKKRNILAAKNRAWEKHIDDLVNGNASKFWKFSKTMMNGRYEYMSAPLKKPDGELTVDPLEKANIFLDQFSPNNDDSQPYNSTYEKAIRMGIVNPTPNYLNIDFSLQEFSSSLILLPDKAMGIDKIHNRMLKNLNNRNRVTLLKIINIIFRHGYIPRAWKCAIVAPILKPNKPPGKAESYRPISLISCLGKIMEKMINSRLKRNLDHMKTLPKIQTGFRRGCTTTDNLIRMSLKSCQVSTTTT